MGGRASLIMVVGFFVIFGIINLNIARLTNRSIGGMIGYGQSAQSRIAASAGINMGLSILTTNPTLRGTILNKNYTTGNFKGSGFTVTALNFPPSGKLEAYVRLRSVSRCTTFVKDQSNSFFILSDTIEVRMDSTSYKGFCELGWMTVTENGVLFATGDTLFGKVHSNGDINIQSGGTPVFWDKVTTSGVIKPASNSAKFKKPPPETRVPARDFPTDLNNINLSANNTTNSPFVPGVNTQTSEIYVTLKPGTSAENDGYAIISTVIVTSAQVGTGTYNTHHPPEEIMRTITDYTPGVKLDSIPLTGSMDKVIYTSGNVHVSGTLDGSLSIASGLGTVRIENDIRYEREPDPAVLDLNAPVNQTTDLLGLIAYGNIIMSDNTANHRNDLTIDAALFSLTGSFTAENYGGRGDDGYIRILGSVAQKTRGPVGVPGSPYNGFHKSYKYDTRMSPPTGSDVALKKPPVFPGFKSKGPLTIKSWWESVREPFMVDDYKY